MSYGSAAEQQAAQGRLRWRGGAELAGRIIRATAEELVWKSPVLSRPVTLDLSALDSVSLRPPASGPGGASRADHAWRLMLTDGTFLNGELKAITPAQVVIETVQHGEVAVDSRWMERLQRHGRGGIVDLIGGRGAGWRSLDRRWAEKANPLGDWDTTQLGRVRTATPEARLLLRTELPEYCEIELSVESTALPAFSLAIGSNGDLRRGAGNLQVETWGDRLMITSPAFEQIVQLAQLDKGARSVSLRLFWNRQMGSVAAYGAGMELLAVAPLGYAPDITTAAILLENRSAELTVTRLRVHPWDGKQVPETARWESRLRTVAGRQHFGTVSGPDAQGRFEIRASDGSVEHVALADMNEIVPEGPRANAPSTAEDNCKLTFHDGTVVRGKLLAVESDTVTVKPAFAPAPLTSPLGGLKLCEFAVASRGDAPAPEHVLEYAGHESHGTLEAVEGALAWRLVGAQTATPLDFSRRLAIRRAKRIADDGQTADAHGDVVVIRNGDHLVCRVVSVDAQSVTVSTSYSESARIPQSDVRAICFDVGAATGSGFDDPGWKFSGRQPDQLQRIPGGIVFHESAGIMHPTLLAGGVLEFDVDWNRKGQSGLIVDLAPAQNDVAAAGQGVVIHPNRRMFYLIFNQNRPIVYVLDGRALRQVNGRAASRFDGPVRIRVQMIDRDAVLFINDQEYGRLAFPEQQRAATGILLQTQQILPKEQQDVRLAMTISNLSSARSGPWLQHLASSASEAEHVLTVPRLRRDRPSSHVLVGRNGDLLRGKLLALGPASVLFHSRLDELIIPRERLAGIVWLSGPTEQGATEGLQNQEARRPMPRPQQPADGRADDAIRVTINNGVVLSFKLERVEADKMVGQHRLLGECRIDLAAIHQLEVGGRGSRTTSVSQDAPEFTEWTLVHAREPVIPDGSGGFGTYSELVGQPAQGFTLPLLDGGSVRLGDHLGKVVVLDFWATWCGPCIQAMPQLMAAVEPFSEDVLLVAVNQGERPEVIRNFLDARGWQLAVALDRDSALGRRYLVAGIPQTVVIGRDGTIKHVQLGFSPDLETALREVLAPLVNGTPDAAVEQP